MDDKNGLYSRIASDPSDDDCILLREDNPMDALEGSGSSSGIFRQRTSIAQVPQLTRLQSSISINTLNAGTPHLEERMRRRLQYFFMNPCQKYQAKRRKPFKLMLQIIKIALVTSQLCLFGEFNLSVVAFRQDNDVIFREVFIGPNATFYTKSVLYSQIENIRKEYGQWRNKSIGIFEYPGVKNGITSAPLLNMSVVHYDITGETGYIPRINLKRSRAENFQLMRWDAKSLKPAHDCVILSNGTCYAFNFETLKEIIIRFGFILFQIDAPRGFVSPLCFYTTVEVGFDNSRHSGALSPKLKSEYHMINCSRDEDSDVTKVKILLNLFDCIIIITCTMSSMLCIRSLWKAQVLRKKFENFFAAQYNKKLNFSERLEFFNLWYLLIIISDILTILGSLSKMILQNQYTGYVDYNVCSIFLGFGCLCVWIGVLRYAGFFHKYNILVLTLKKSLPHVCRFMVCASVLYLGFMFCGWAMLGPHHHKFRNLVVTSEALFSLINGDDMYMTYEEMSRQSTLMFVVSQIYLYVFIALFIYVVLSLFIAVIMDTYETIKERQEGDMPEENEIEKFVRSSTAEPCVENFRFELRQPTYCDCFGCCSNEDEFLTDEE